MRTILLVAVIAIFLTGCATGHREITKYNLDFQPDMSSSLEKDGLKIEVEPITGSNYETYSAINTPVSYGYTKGVYKYNFQGPWSVVLLPAFQVTMTNFTDHIIKFNRVVIKLEDDAGNLYDCLDKSELRDTMKNIIEKYEQSKEIFIDQEPIFSKMHDLTIVDNNFDLLPGYTQSGYITFNLPRSGSDKNFLAGKQYLKLLMFEIPTEMDDAGKVKKTTRFEFIWDVNSETVTIN